MKVLNNVKIHVFSDNLRSRLLFVSSIQLRKTYFSFQTRTYKYLSTKDSQYESSGINTDYFNDLLFSTSNITSGLRDTEIQRGEKSLAVSIYHPRNNFRQLYLGSNILPARKD